MRSISTRRASRSPSSCQRRRSSCSSNPSPASPMGRTSIRTSPLSVVPGIRAKVYSPRVGAEPPGLPAAWTGGGARPRREASGEPFGLVLAEVALEQPPVALLVVEDRDDHVLRHRIDALG